MRPSKTKILNTIAYYALERLMSAVRPGEASSEQIEDFWRRQFEYADKFYGPDLKAGRLTEKDKRRVFQIANAMLDRMEVEGSKLQELKRD